MNMTKPNLHDELEHPEDNTSDASASCQEDSDDHNDGDFIPEHRPATRGRARQRARKEKEKLDSIQAVAPLHTECAKCHKTQADCLRDLSPGRRTKPRAQGTWVLLRHQKNKRQRVITYSWNNSHDFSGYCCVSCYPTTDCSRCKRTALIHLNDVWNYCGFCTRFQYTERGLATFKRSKHYVELQNNRQEYQAFLKEEKAMRQAVEEDGQ